MDEEVEVDDVDELTYGLARVTTLKDGLTSKSSFFVVEENNEQEKSFVLLDCKSGQYFCCRVRGLWWTEVAANVQEHRYSNP